MGSRTMLLACLFASLALLAQADLLAIPHGSALVGSDNASSAPRPAIAAQNAQAKHKDQRKHRSKAKPKSSKKGRAKPAKSTSCVRCRSSSRILTSRRSR